MNVGPPPPAPVDQVERSRQKIARLLEEAAHLSELDLSPEDYFDAFLKRVMTGLTALAGAVWLRSAAGDWQLQAQINYHLLGIEQGATDRQAHRDLLQQAFEHNQALHVRPRSALPAASAQPSATNPTGYEVLFMPIPTEGAAAGLVEVWHAPYRHPEAVPGYFKYLQCLAELAARFLQRRSAPRPAAAPQVWTELEAFAQQIHATLDLTEVAYLTANEGRRLCGGDRLSIATRRGRRTVVRAVSGVDVIEQRSSLVQQMRRLLEAVLDWGEPLIYRGSPDDSLPPPVLEALDRYLAESSCRLLVVFPLRDERDGPAPIAHAGLLLECFEAAAPAEQLSGRLEVIGRHAGSALYNAAVYHRVPLRRLWQRRGRGRSRALPLLGTLGLACLAAALVFIPYPLKVSARGQLLPRERRWLYAPVEGQVVRFEDAVQPGSTVAVDQPLVLMYDMQLEIRLTQLTNEIAGAQQAIEALARQEGGTASEADRSRFGAEKRQKEFLRDRKMLERKALHDRARADETRSGYFWLRAPIAGTILNSDFREVLTNRSVRPSEPLLRLGDKQKGWEVELKIPQKDMGPMLDGLAAAGAAGELDVDLVFLSAPTQVYKGKLPRRRVASQAGASRDGGPESEPVVAAFVRLDGADLVEAGGLPPDLLVTGSEVRARIRCGDRPLGDAMFHGVWEFFCEKVLFFF